MVIVVSVASWQLAVIARRRDVALQIVALSPGPCAHCVATCKPRFSPEIIGTRGQSSPIKVSSGSANERGVALAAKLGCRVGEQTGPRAETVDIVGEEVEKVDEGTDCDNDSGAGRWQQRDGMNA